MTCCRRITPITTVNLDGASRRSRKNVVGDYSFRALSTWSPSRSMAIPWYFNPKRFYTPFKLLWSHRIYSSVLIPTNLKVGELFILDDLHQLASQPHLLVSHCGVDVCFMPSTPTPLTIVSTVIVWQKRRSWQPLSCRAQWPFTSCSRRPSSCRIGWPSSCWTRCPSSRR